MTREAILDVIKKHLAVDIDVVDVDAIDPKKSMVDYGANSLDLVEVVSRSMRELKVKVPRSELNKLENIEQLVELFHKTLEEKAAG